MSRFIDHDAMLWEWGVHLQGDKPLPADPPATPNHELAATLREVADAIGANLIDRAATLADAAMFTYWDWIGGLRESRSPILADAEPIGRDIYRVLEAAARKGATTSDAATLRTAADLVYPQAAQPAITPPTDRSGTKLGPVERAIGIIIHAQGKISITAAAKEAGCHRTTLHNSDQFMAVYRQFQAAAAIPHGHKTDEGDVEAYDD